MMPLFCMLWCLLLGNNLLPAGGTRTPRLSRLDLVRAANANQQQSTGAQQTIQPSMTPLTTAPVAKSPRKKNRPPFPTIPNDPLNFSSQQKKVYDDLVRYAPLLKDPVSYSDTAKKIKNLIDGKIMGTDPRTIIRQRKELQQTLLAVVLPGLSKEELIAARQANKINDAQLTEAVDAARDLHKELNKEQWLNLDLNKNPDLKEQYLNENDAYAEFTDVPLSSADAATLGDLEEATQKITSPLLLFGGAAAASAAISSLVIAWKKARAAKLTEKSSAAIEAATELAEADIPEGLTADQKKELDGVLKDMVDATSGTNAELKQKIQTTIHATLLDITDQEDPTTEFNKLLEDLTVVLTSPDIKVSTSVVVQSLTTQFTRATELIMTLVKAATRGGINTAYVNNFFTALTSLPTDFFSNIQALLSTQTLTPAQRDAFVKATIDLLKLGQVQASFIGLTATAMIEKSIKTFDEVSLSLTGERAAYTALTITLQDIKALLQDIARDNKLMAINFQSPPRTPGGAPLQRSDVNSNHPEIPSIATLEAPQAFLLLMNQLVSVLTSEMATIVNNAKLYRLLLGTASINPEEIPQRIRKVLSDDHKAAITNFFTIKDKIRTQVTTKTGETFTETTPNSSEQEILQALYAYYNGLYTARQARPLVIKPNLLSSNDTFIEMLSAQRSLFELITQAINTRPELAALVRDSITVRAELFGACFFDLSPDFFKQVEAKMSNNRFKYMFSEYGYLLCQALISIEQGSPEFATSLTTLQDLFKQLSITPTVRSLMSSLFLYIENTIKAYAILKQTPADTAALDTYSEALISLSKFLSNNDTQEMSVVNYFVYYVLFPENMPFLSGVAKEASTEGLTALITTIKTLQNIVKSLDETTTRAQHKPALSIALQTLLSNAQDALQKASERLNPEAQGLYTLLSGTFIKFKNIETYAKGLCEACAVFQNSKYREIIGDSQNKQLYTLIFNPDGVFCLPATIILDTQSPVKLDPVTIEAGWALFNCIKQNPNDLNLKNDPLNKVLVDKFFAFFDALKNPATGPTQTAQQKTQAEAAVKAATAEQAEMIKDSPDAAAIQQLTEYITTNANQLTSKEKIGEFARNLQSQISTKSKRLLIARDAKLKALFFSDKGVLISPSALPTFITPGDLDDVIKMYKTIQSNPKELGFTSKDGESDSLNTVMNQLKAIMAPLQKLKEWADDDSRNYEDVEAYEYATASGAKKKGYVTFSGLLATGSIQEPAEAMGPKIVNGDELGWSIKQVDLYNALYNLFKDLRSVFMSKFVAAINIILQMITGVDQDETFFIKAGRFAKMTELRRILNKKPLEDAFHAAVLGIETLPRDFAEADFQKEREVVKKFYETLKDNPRKFEMRAEEIGKVKNILNWINDPSKAPTIEQNIVMDGGLDLSANGMNGMGMMGGMGMMNPMMGMMGMGANGGRTVNPNSAAGMLGMNRSGGMNPIMMGGMGMMGGMNPMMMSGMGMNPMMGSMGMMGGMNPMMMGGMGMMGMPGMSQQQTLTQDDLKKAIQDQRMQDTLTELKTRALIQDMFPKSGGQSSEASAQLLTSLNQTVSVEKKDDQPKLSEEYLTARAKAYQKAETALVGKKDALDLLGFLKKHGLALFNASKISTFCSTMYEEFKTRLKWWKATKDITNDKSILYQTIFSEYGLLVDTDLMPSSIASSDAQDVKKLYKYLSDEFELSSASKGSINMMLNFLKRLAPDDSETPAPVVSTLSTTETEDEENSDESKKKKSSSSPSTPSGLTIGFDAPVQATSFARQAVVA